MDYKIKKEYQRLIVVNLLVLGILFPFLGVQGVAVNLVWSEDFEAPPFDWYLAGYEQVSGNPAITYRDDNYIPVIENGLLQMPNTQTSWYFSQALRNSTVAYGSWGFDFTIKPDEDQINHSCMFNVYFISNCTRDLHGEPSFTEYQNWGIYSIGFNSEEVGPEWVSFLYQSIWLLCVLPQSGITILGQYNFTDPITGTHHIDITRNSTNGEFNVYFDSSTNPEPLITAIDNNITTSENMMFYSSFGDTSFDNITVSSTIDIEIPPDTSTDPQQSSFTVSSTIDIEIPPDTSTDPQQSSFAEIYLIILPLIGISLIMRRRR